MIRFVFDELRSDRLISVTPGYGHESKDRPRQAMVAKPTSNPASVVIRVICEWSLCVSEHIGGTGFDPRPSAPQGRGCCRSITLRQKSRVICSDSINLSNALSYPSVGHRSIGTPLTDFRNSFYCVVCFHPLLLYHHSSDSSLGLCSAIGSQIYERAGSGSVSNKILHSVYIVGLFIDEHADGML